jgi:hypothetical protein
MSELLAGLDGGVVGLAVGTAGAAIAEAAFEAARQESWKEAQSKIHELDELAALVAQGLVSLVDVEEDAARNGYGPDELAAAVQLALKAPAVSEALTLYRRRHIDKVDDATALAHLRHAFAKAQLEVTYWPQLEQTATAALEPAVIAEAIQRGLMVDPGFLPVGPPQTVGNVKAFPVSTLDPLAEAAAAGVDRERLFVTTGLVGNPVGPHEAADALFRGVIDEPSFERAIAEGRTRNEWGFVYKEISRVIPTVHDYVEARLRAWITTDDEMYAGAARHGATPEDVDLLLKVTGRPLSAHQVWVALLRGGVYDGPVDAIEPAFLKAAQESNIRPEWFNLLWAQRWTQPAPFLLRQWLQDGGDPEWARLKLRYQAWEPGDIDKFVAQYAKQPKAKPSAAIQSATSAFLTATRSRYAAGKLPLADAQTALTAAGVPDTDQARMLELWNAQLAVEAAGSTTAGGGSAGGPA